MLVRIDHHRVTFALWDCDRGDLLLKHPGLVRRGPAGLAAFGKRVLIGATDTISFRYVSAVSGIESIPNSFSIFGFTKRQPIVVS